MKRLLLVALCALLLAACTPGNATKIKTVDLKKQFGPYTGTFKLHDLTANTYTAYNPEPADRRYAPASTFKVLHSLIALQTGAVKNAKEVRPWNGTVHPIESWNRDQTLESAVKDSVIWYFQDIAREIGRTTEQEYLDKTGYGNRRIGEAIDSFWLDGSLAISVDEQLDFMTRFYREELPFDRQVIQTVKRVLVARQDGTVTLAGKTGTAVRVQPNVGWYVGYIVSGERPCTFVTRIEGRDVSGMKAKEITEAVLKDLGLLNP